MDNRELVALILKRGWTIFPCGQDKRPIIKTGYKGAGRDKKVIEKWFAQYPDFKIGVPCVPNLFFAVDVDPDGIDTWKQWVKDNDNNTGVGPRQTTPRGGTHILYKLPNGLKIINNAGKIAPGIDFRSDGYICTDASSYKWGSGDCGISSPLWAAPEWLLNKIREYIAKKEQAELDFTKNAQAYEPKTSDDNIGEYWFGRAIATARIGNRNQTGFELACQLRDSRYSKVQAEEYMRRYVAAVPKCDDPYLLKEAMASLKEAYGSPPREPAQFKPLNQRTGTTSAREAPGGTDSIPAVDPSEVIDIPLGFILRSDQVAKLDSIAFKRKIFRHDLVREIVVQYLSQNENGEFV